MKVIIAGSRGIEDYRLLKQVIKSSNYEITEVVSGGCRGADALGERWAKEKNIPIKHFYAQWKKYGKSAGPIRNLEMVKYVGEEGAAIFLWDGKSRGTQHTMNMASDEGLNMFTHMVL